MPDYHKMYLHLFNQSTKAIDILQSSQARAEDLYVEGEEPVVCFQEIKTEEK